MNGARAPEIRSFGDFVSFFLSELKPRGKLITPFNVISLPIMIIGLILIVIRLVKGLGAVTNLSNQFPWGLWIGFDVITGVAFAGGAYTLCFIVYILNVEKYHSIVRATVLNGLLAYMFYAGAIFLDIGRWWNIYNPMIGNKFGVQAVLFLVAWHFLLYMIAEAVEFSPTVAEWLGLKRARKILSGMTIGAVVAGVFLSTLHQSALGALALMTKGKLHPLWFTEFIPLLFFVSSIFGGLSMVVFEGSITHKVFHFKLSQDKIKAYGDILAGLSRICAGAMLAYLLLKLLVLAHTHAWHYLNTPWGYWYLFEVVGLTFVPMLIFIAGARSKNNLAIRAAAMLTLLGVMLNRLNHVFIAYKWYIPLSQRYYPSIGEIIVTLTIIFVEIWVFRWIVHRMPVLEGPPAWAKEEVKE